MKFYFVVEENISGISGIHGQKYIYKDNARYEYGFFLMERGYSDRLKAKEELLLQQGRYKRTRTNPNINPLSFYIEERDI